MKYTLKVKTNAVKNQVSTKGNLVLIRGREAQPKTGFPK